MRDICILTVKDVRTEELVECVRVFASRASQACEKRPNESVVGEPPDVLYVFDMTDPTNCCFSLDEKAAIESKLDAQVSGCVSTEHNATPERSWMQSLPPGCY